MFYQGTTEARMSVRLVEISANRALPGDPPDPDLSLVGVSGIFKHLNGCKGRSPSCSKCGRNRDSLSFCKLAVDLRITATFTAHYDKHNLTGSVYWNVN